MKTDFAIYMAATLILLTISVVGVEVAGVSSGLSVVVGMVLMTVLDNIRERLQQQAANSGNSD